MKLVRIGGRAATMQPEGRHVRKYVFSVSARLSWDEATTLIRQAHRMNARSVVPSLLALVRGNTGRSSRIVEVETGDRGGAVLGKPTVI